MQNLIRIPSSILECPNYVNGQLKWGQGPQFQIKSPYTGNVIGKAQESTEQDVDEAINYALKAARDWKETPLKERCHIMFNVRNLLLQRIDEISHIISSESGKLLSEAKAEIMKGIEVLEFALSLQNEDVGGKMEVSRGVTCEFQRFPLGVVAGITPFNFPAMVPMWMIPIALTLGNAFIWKPSDKTPLTSTFLINTFSDGGLPAGVLTTLQGGRKTVEAICAHPDIAAIGFVGSTQVAKQVYLLGTQNYKRVLALGGAKNHIILMPDADMELASQGIVDSFTGCAGQRCMAASVLLAVGGVEDYIKNIKIKAKEKELGLDMGAIITSDSLQFLGQSLAKAQEEGAKIILDGRLEGRSPSYPKEYGAGGNWLAPSLLDHVSPNSHAARTELFGPILSIIRCKDLSEALKIQNSSPYGNATSVFTSNGGIAERVSKEASSGMVGVNIGVPVPREPFSFGGIGDSKFGQGDITGRSSLDFWSHLKKITRKWAVQRDQTWMS